MLRIYLFHKIALRPWNTFDDKMALIPVCCAIMQQAITWANFGLDLCCHMESLGHIEVIGNISICLAIECCSSVIFVITQCGKATGYLMWVLGIYRIMMRHDCHSFAGGSSRSKWTKQPAASHISFRGSSFNYRPARNVPLRRPISPRASDGIAVNVSLDGLLLSAIITWSWNNGMHCMFLYILMV